MASAAEAQSRKPLRLTVQPRSYLNPGVVVPVGSLQNYATFNRYEPISTAPTFIKSDAALPPRIGGGRNPFGPIDWTAR
ncbi:MAG: hypothetical protein BGP06_21320 [Rhizobiales bacterium 65-9]|nr:MAG: hypothetical protein BGP06_21320 [Rhizobiales bacterium 65-9]